MSATRTLQFLGYAYGNTPVILNAHINGNLVFSGQVATVDTPISDPADGLPGNQVLFSATDPSLSTDFSGALPMTVSVATGYGILIGQINSNYMLYAAPTTPTIMENSTINGTTLTVGTVTSGNPKVGMPLHGDGVAANTVITAGSGLSWTVEPSQTVAATTITYQGFEHISGNATGFLECYNGTPTNSEGTPDPRSSVYVDGVQQVPPKAVSPGVWTWEVDSGSTISYNLNLSIGNVA
jgi:hypothetical protein